MANGSLANFDIIIYSRHSKAHGYDTENHRYRPEYISAAPDSLFGYRFDLDASPGFTQALSDDDSGVIHLVNLGDLIPALPGNLDDFLGSFFDDSIPGGGPGNPGGDKQVPDDILSYTWTIRKGAQVIRELTMDRETHGSRFWVARNIRVPSVGRYEITLQVNLKDGTQVAKSRSIRLRDATIVVLGESFASGEGNPDAVGTPFPDFGDLQCKTTSLSFVLGIGIVMNNEPRWQEPNAHRSYRSGFSLAAEAIENQGDLITFLNFARSGAQISKGLINPGDRDDWIGKGQIAEARETIGDREIDALIISIGGNDIGFAGGLRDLVAKDFSWLANLTSDGDDDKNREKVIQDARESIGKLEDEDEGDFAKLKTEIDKFNARHVFLVEYPTGLFDRVKNGDVTSEPGCGIFEGLDQDIDREDAEAIATVGRELNEMLRRVANRHGWIMIDGIDGGFAGHGYCDEDTFFVGAEASCRQQGDFDGTMHPNHKGHQVYKDRIVATLKDRLFGQSLPIVDIDTLPSS